MAPKRKSAAAPQTPKTPKAKPMPKKRTADASAKGDKKKAAKADHCELPKEINVASDAFWQKYAGKNRPADSAAPEGTATDPAPATGNNKAADSAAPQGSTATDPVPATAQDPSSAATNVAVSSLTPAEEKEILAELETQIIEDAAMEQNRPEQTLVSVSAATAAAAAAADGMDAAGEASASAAAGKSDNQDDRAADTGLVVESKFT